MKRLKRSFLRFRWWSRPADDDPAADAPTAVPTPPTDAPPAGTPAVVTGTDTRPAALDDSPDALDDGSGDVVTPLPGAPTDRVPPAPDPGPAPGAGRDPRIDAAVAADVLDVGDLLENLEIRLRLAEALAALPDIEVLAPDRGQPYDRRRHRWVETTPTDDPAAVETIAHVISAGLADRQGRVLRAARVAVFNVKED